MGISTHSFSASVSVIANDETWIESSAVQQLEKTAQLKGIIQAIGMPDLHPGRGYPIGASFLSNNTIYPALVGSDIGCGMSLWQTNLKSRKPNLDKLEKRLTGLDHPLDYSWADLLSEEQALRNLTPTVFDRSLGTIGGGNHFAELQQLDDIYAKRTCDELELNKDRLMLLVHSGSRGLGERILRDHVDQFSHQGLSVDSTAFDTYLQRHNQALRFAELNRKLIALRMLEALNTDGKPMLDVNHNLVDYIDCPDVSGWIHRKGATPADRGLVMIPGSRGDYSYLVQPKPDAKSLYSLAHGAGRKWTRTECKGRLDKRYRVQDLERTAFGSRVICKDKALIFEEAPEAYKRIDSVIAAMLDADLIELVARFKPVLTYKTQGGCC